MLLTISTTHRPANDLGYLLHKRPDRFQSFDLSFGKAHVYYPEVSAERCTECLMLDVDAVGMVRGKNPDQSFLLGQYVNLILLFDTRKNHFVGDDETDKLLAKGEDWLARRPQKEEIARSCLRFQPSFRRMVLSRLVVEEEPVEGEDETPEKTRAEETLKKPFSLNERRLMTVAASPRHNGEVG